jgi:hypothetical protein
LLIAKYGSIISLKIITTSATAQNWKKKKNTYWEVFQLVVFFKVLNAMTGNELPKKHYSLFSHHNLMNLIHHNNMQYGRTYVQEYAFAHLGSFAHTL